MYYCTNYCSAYLPLIYSIKTMTKATYMVARVLHKYDTCRDLHHYNYLPIIFIYPDFPVYVAILKITILRIHIIRYLKVVQLLESE